MLQALWSNASSSYEVSLQTSSRSNLTFFFFAWHIFYYASQTIKPIDWSMIILGTLADKRNITYTCYAALCNVFALLIVTSVRVRMWEENMLRRIFKKHVKYSFLCLFGKNSRTSSINSTVGSSSKNRFKLRTPITVLLPFGGYMASNRKRFGFSMNNFVFQWGWHLHRKNQSL